MILVYCYSLSPLEKLDIQCRVNLVYWWLRWCHHYYGSELMLEISCTVTIHYSVIDTQPDWHIAAYTIIHNTLSHWYITILIHCCIYNHSQYVQSLIHNHTNTLLYIQSFTIRSVIDTYTQSLIIHYLLHVVIRQILSLIRTH